jgi:hypothetical protein
MVQYVLRGIVLATPLHEYCHLVALRLLGGRGFIVSWALDEMQPQTYTHDQLIGATYAGGICSGLIWLILSWRDGNAENRLISRMMGINHIVYGIFEGTAFLLQRSDLIGIGALIGATLVMGILVTYFVTRSENLTA